MDLQFGASSQQYITPTNQFEFINQNQPFAYSESNIPVINGVNDVTNNINNNNANDNAFNNEIKFKMQSAKRNRTMLQQNSQILSNRVNLLQQEQEKSNKKMLEMQKKMQIILKIKQSNQMNRLFRENFKKQQEENLQRLMQINNQKRIEQNQKNQLSKNHYQQRVLKQVQSLKGSMQHQKDVMSQMLEEIKNRNSYSTQYIKQQQDKWTQNRQQFFQNKRNQLGKYNNYVYMNECQHTSQVQEQYKNLEQQEFQALENLKKTQGLEKQVKSDFERFVGSAYLTKQPVNKKGNFANKGAFAVSPYLTQTNNFNGKGSHFSVQSTPQNLTLRLPASQDGNIFIAKQPVTLQFK